jgi:hypothetical protein
MRAKDWTIAALAVATVAGCGSHKTPHSIAVETYRGYPKADPPMKAGIREPTAVRIGSTRIALTFFGSGSCPPVPTSEKWISSTTLEVNVDDSYPGACTSDEAATTSVISVLPRHLPAGSFVIRFTGGASQVPPSSSVR